LSPRAPGAASAPAMRSVSRLRSVPAGREGPSASAARTSARFVRDLAPGTVTSASTGPAATGAFQLLTCSVSPIAALAARGGCEDVGHVWTVLARLGSGTARGGARRGRPGHRSASGTVAGHGAARPPVQPRAHHTDQRAGRGGGCPARAGAPRHALG